jgi:transposase-like protein
VPPSKDYGSLPGIHGFWPTCPSGRGSRKKEPFCIAQGTDPEGYREIPGFFLMGSEGESAHAWREIFSELRERG